MTGAAQNVTVN